MTDAQGGFYSTQDADSEGVEGKFFVWSLAEVEALLGKRDATLVCFVLQRDGGGKFRRSQYSEYQNRPLAEIRRARKGERSKNSRLLLLNGRQTLVRSPRETHKAGAR